MAIRNVLRQKRRSFLTGLMMMFSFVLLSFTIAFESGTYDQIIAMFTEQYVGHVQIHSKKYIKSPSIYDTLENEKELLLNLKQEKNVRSFSNRVIGGALTSFGNKTFGAQVFGVDFKKENETTGIEKRIALGKLPATSVSNKVLIGGKLAQVLGAKLGDEVVLISSGADGSIANDLFKIEGIFQSESQSKDDFRIYANIEYLREFFVLGEQSHEIAINLNSMSNITKFKNKFLPGDGNEVRSWKEIEKDFYKAMQADRKGSDVSFFIIMMIVGMGVLNTVLMATLERTREFGVLKVIGTTPLNITLLVVIETLIISIIAILVGSCLATFINLYFQFNGIDLGESFSYGGVTFDVMYAHVSLKSYMIPTIIILITSTVVSLYPGYKASRLSPVEAMRDF